MNQKGHSFNPTLILTACYVFVFILVASYVFIYQVVPFEGAVNDSVLNALITFAALLAAVVSTAVFSHYHPEDHPRKVWLNIAIGCWFWFLSEAIWGVNYFYFEEVPTPSLADVGWAVGYVFFAIAIYYQYILILPSRQKRIRNIIYGVSAAVLVLPLLALSVMHLFTLENYINYLYPTADLAVGISGLTLVYFFRGGMLMRPWIGMVVFGISDFFYAWAVQVGIYEWSVQNGNLFTLFADSSYLFAYLFLTLGFVHHWILINYGLRGNQK
jgi:hypothetical protein